MRETTKADEQSDAVRRSQEVDSDEVDGNGISSRKPSAGSSGGGGSNGLMSRYWSTTSVLDMANAYNRSVMPSLLTDAEERMLDDVAEEDSEWEESDCESGSGSDCQSDGDDEEISSPPIFPNSHSLPEMHADLVRQRSSSLPKHTNGELEHPQARRQSSRLLRGESLRRQLFQDRVLCSPGMRRNTSIECLTRNRDEGIDRSASADGGASTSPGSSAASDATTAVAPVRTATAMAAATAPLHTVIGYSLPMWCSPQTPLSSHRTSTSGVSPLADHLSLQLCSSDPVAAASLVSGDCLQQAQRRLSDTGGTYAQKSRSLTSTSADHRRSYMLAIDPTELPLAKNNTLRRLKKIGKLFRHKESESDDCHRSTAFSGVSESSAASNDSSITTSPHSLEESVFLSTEAADDFVYTTPAKANAARRGRITSAPVMLRVKDMLRRKPKREHSSAVESVKSDDTCSSLSEPSSRGSSPETSEPRRHTVGQRFQSPVLTRRWKLAHGSHLEQKHSSSVPSHLHTLTAPASPEPPVRPFIQNLMDIDPRHLAEEITLLDAQRQQRIEACELLNCAWMSKERESVAPNIMNMVEHFNRLALITTKEVLKPTSAEKRAKAIGYFIKVGEECLKLNNFNSLKAILAGLQCTPMFRLQRTWKELSANKMKRFTDLSELMSETKNYIMYRHRMMEALENPPCIPFLGVFLTQICQMESFNQLHRRRRSSRRTSTRRRLSRRGTKGKNDTDRPAIRRKSTKRGARSAAARAANAERYTELPAITQVDESSTNAPASKSSVEQPAKGTAGAVTVESQPTDEVDGSAAIQAACCLHDGCPLDRVDMTVPVITDVTAATENAAGVTKQEVSAEQAAETANETATERAADSATEIGTEETLSDDVHERPTQLDSTEDSHQQHQQQAAGSASPASIRSVDFTSHRRPHDSLISEDSAYNSDFGSRASSTTLVCRTDSASDGRDEAATLSKRHSPADQPSPLLAASLVLKEEEETEEQSAHGTNAGNGVAPAVEESPPKTGAAEENVSLVTTEHAEEAGKSTAAATDADRGETTEVDGSIRRVRDSEKRKIKVQQLSSSSMRSTNLGNVRERLTTVVGNMVQSPQSRRRAGSETSVAHGGSNSLTKLRVPSPNSSLVAVSEAAVPRAADAADAAAVGASVGANPQSAAVAGSLEAVSSCRVTPHMSLEEQLRRYKLAASCYHHASKPWVRYLLDNYCCNTEEENYVLSCEREPKQDGRKSWFERLTS